MFGANMGHWVSEGHEHDYPPAEEGNFDAVWECECGKRFRVARRMVGRRMVKQWMPLVAKSAVTPF